MHQAVISSRPQGSLRHAPANDLPLSEVRNLRPLEGVQSRINDLFGGSYEGFPVVVKFSNPTWDREKALNENVGLSFVGRATSVPVPRVLGTGRTFTSLTGRPEERDYLVLAALPGTPWSSCNLDERAHARAVSQLAHFVRELRTHVAQSFGSLSFDRQGLLSVKPTFEIPGGKAPHIPTFSQYVAYFADAYLGKIESLPGLVRKSGLCMRTFREQVSRAVDRIADSCAGTPDVFVLSHQDLVRKNILVDQASGEITAVLDWEWAGFAMPEMELLSGCDFLRDLREKVTFADIAGIDLEIAHHRQLGYALVSHLYRMASCCEWKKDKVGLTARFFADKAMQRRASEFRTEPSEIFKVTKEMIFRKFFNMDAA